MTPKISIITVVYNAEYLIERTIESVLSQTYPNIEYIIIDGASTDKTLLVINKYSNKIPLIKSERDKGIYDAMNKGLALSTGEYVLFLNAGDELYEPQTLENIFKSTPFADVYYGNTAVVDMNRNILGDRRLTPPEQLNWMSFKYGMNVSHQSFIAKRSLCEPYDLTYKLAADIDWIIKILKKSKSIYFYHNSYISKFLEGGLTTQKRKLAWEERYAVLAKHYGYLPNIFNHIYIVMRFIIHKFTHKSMT